MALTVRYDESQFQHARTPGAVCLDEWSCFLHLMSEIIFCFFSSEATTISHLNQGLIQALQ